jgi:hypothetical protein
MDFCDALKALKDGGKVTNFDWEGAAIDLPFLSMTPGQKDVPADKIWSPHNRAAAERTGFIDVSPSITLCDHRRGVIVMGWVPSQRDLFGENWSLIVDLRDASGSQARVAIPGE